MKKNHSKRKFGNQAISESSSDSKRTGGAPFTEQDPKRRLGNFSGTGEHPRQGGRTSGIVGQTKQRNHTDKHS